MQLFTGHLAPARLLSMFVLLAALPLGAMGWLGSKMLEQEGEAEANKVYERLIRDFKEQTGAVSIARARLGRTPVTQSASTPTATGTNRNTVFSPVFSKDGRQLAYVWTTEQEWELRVTNLQESGAPRFRKLLGDRYVQPFDWTPPTYPRALSHSLRAILPPARNEKSFDGRTWETSCSRPNGRFIATGVTDTATRGRVVLLIPIAGGEPRVARRSTPSQTSTPQPGVWVLENFLPKASK